MESMRYFKGRVFNYLYLKKDKEIVRSLKDFQSLDELIAYYENIFAMYDSIIGLDGSAVENKKKSKSLFFKSRYIRSLAVPIMVQIGQRIVQIVQRCG